MDVRLLLSSSNSTNKIFCKSRSSWLTRLSYRIRFIKMFIINITSIYIYQRSRELYIPMSDLSSRLHFVFLCIHSLIFLFYFFFYTFFFGALWGLKSAKNPFFNKFQCDRSRQPRATRAGILWNVWSSGRSPLVLFSLAVKKKRLYLVNLNFVGSIIWLVRIPVWSVVTGNLDILSSMRKTHTDITNSWSELRFF